MKIESFILVFLFSLTSILNAQNLTTPSPPDYNNLKYWAAHPEKDSPALAIPGKGGIDKEDLLDVDIFYIHPTSYTSKERKLWNADLSNRYLNERTDGYVIKNQASIFNQVGLIYAPRYRQAHISAYGLKNGDNKNQIFNTAYTDVKDAFDHYIKYFNEGKPFILATHSQGTTHGKRLIKEVIEADADILNRMVVAYLVGMDVKHDEFASVKPCEKPNETGCFTSWRTMRKDNEPPARYRSGDEYVATNPLTWDSEKTTASKELHMGAILRRFNKIHTYALSSEVKEGILYVNRPKFPFSFLMKWTDYHILDFNLFYYNVQFNARQRASRFLGLSTGKSMD